MSILARLLAWLGRPVPTPPKTPDPEALSLRDWADLPPHHPRCETC